MYIYYMLYIICYILYYIIYYIIYTPDWGMVIREQGRFRGSTRGAGGCTRATNPAHHVSSLLSFNSLVQINCIVAGGLPQLTFLLPQCRL